MGKKGTWYVYSPMLEAFIATGFVCKTDALWWVSQYHDRVEASQMSVGLV
jgi:hypothetical protein